MSEAITLQRESGFQFLADTFRTQGHYFLEAKDYESASKSFREAAQVDEIDGDEEYLASATNCYTVAELRKDNELMCKGAFAKAKAHMLLGDFDQAARDLSEADYLASSSTDWDQILEIQEEYKILYLNLNKFEEAAKIEGKIATIREILE